MRIVAGMGEVIKAPGGAHGADVACYNVYFLHQFFRRAFLDRRLKSSAVKTRLLPSNFFIDFGKTICLILFR
jgi:hypothetical protein